jgi:hypothetical protein
VGYPQNYVGGKELKFLALDIFRLTSLGKG